MKMKFPGKNDNSDMTNTTYSRVREQLRYDILSNKFAPGSRLKILDLVNLYNVSQMPIREALQQLQGEGLVVIEQHKGAYVRQINRKYISDIFDIRRVLEVYLTLESSKFMTDELIQRLRKIQGNCVIAANKNDYKTLLKHNEQFHTLIYKTGNNEEAFRLLEGRWQLINSLRLSYGFNETRTVEIIDEHEAILKALEQKNEAALERAANAHCLRAKKDLLTRLEKVSFSSEAG